MPREERDTTRAGKEPVLAVLQLTGGNDYLNTVVPYANPLYRDYRPAVGIPEDQVIPLDDNVGLHPRTGPMKAMYDRADMAIVHGVGYPNSPRSHFRSLDIWHTCEPDTLGTEGWLGRAARDIDPHKENVLTAVAFVLGKGIQGGQYGEYPSMEEQDLEQGDVAPNHDFRGLYSTIIEDWMGLDAKPIVEGSFEKLPFIG